MQERPASPQEEVKAQDEEAAVLAQEEAAAMLLPVSEIDGFWLQKRLGECYQEPEEVMRMEAKVLEILGDEDQALHQCESALALLFEFEHDELLKQLLHNRHAVFYGVSLAQAQGEAVQRLQERMRSSPSSAVQRLYSTLYGDALPSGVAVQADAKHTGGEGDELAGIRKEILDLETFAQGSVAPEKVKLHTQPIYKKRQGYEQVEIEAAKPTPLAKGEKLIQVSELPEWVQPVFPFEALNRIQSVVYPAAFQTDESLLICAPTSAGKTNIALLSLLRLLSLHRLANGDFETDKFKAVFIAPMKALVAETVGNLRGRFSGDTHFSELKVRELTGDMQLSKEQIEDTQVIVTTPEKWDIVTRKAGEKAFLEKVQLLIVDEVHMLHDERGPVLEAVLARILR